MRNAPRESTRMQWELLRHSPASIARLATTLLPLGNRGARLVAPTRSRRSARVLAPLVLADLSPVMHLSTAATAADTRTDLMKITCRPCFHCQGSIDTLFK